jgi:hypothetical protein
LEPPGQVALEEVGFYTFDGFGVDSVGESLESIVVRGEKKKR